MRRAPALDNLLSRVPERQGAPRSIPPPLVTVAETDYSPSGGGGQAKSGGLAVLNGHSHVRASLLGPSVTVPFADGRLLLGTWQQIVLVDFDNRPRRREVVVQLSGEKRWASGLCFLVIDARPGQGVVSPST